LLYLLQHTGFSALVVAGEAESANKMVEAEVAEEVADMLRLQKHP